MDRECNKCFEKLKDDEHYKIVCIEGINYPVCTNCYTYFSGLDEENNHDEEKVVAFIEDMNLNFNLGNVIKYLARSGRKGDKKKDLEKALWYLERELHIISLDFIFDKNKEY